MLRIDLLHTKAGMGASVALSLMILSVFLTGCQAPPVPDASSDAAAPVSPKTEGTGMNAASEPADAHAVSEEVVVESGPDKPNDVQADPDPVIARQATPPAETAPAVTQADSDTVAAVEEARDETSNQAAPVTEAQATPERPNREPVRTSSPGRTSPAVVQTQTVEPAIPASPDAKVFVVESVYDFGEISPLEKPTGSFHIKNIGTAVLYLTRVKLCCGARHTLSSDELQPGETSVLTVTYVANTIGKFEKYLNVYSNDASNPDVKLTIKGTVVRRLAWTPARFKLFLDKENGGCLPITISSTDGEPFSLKSFSATEDCLTADVDPNKVAKKFVLYPKVDLEKLGSLKIPKGMVRIKHTHQGCDIITLNYDLFKRYAYAPKRFLVLNADQRKSRTQRLSILDNYADSLSLKKGVDGEESMFAIKSVDCEKGTVALKSTKQIKDGYQLTFEITPPDPAGQRLFQDLITIVLSTGDEVQVPVNGIYSMAALTVSQGEK